MQDSKIWQNREKALNLSQELALLKKDIEEMEEIAIELEILEETPSEEGIKTTKKKIQEKEIEIYLGGKYDKGNAILEIMAGVGGRDSEDWVTMLQRMYERYCQRKGFKVEILSQTLGEPGGPEGRIGTKSVTLEIRGKYAYGFLKWENGVHRLVRISPFSPQALRHTSFALVRVLPQIPDPAELDIKIKPEDLKIDFFKASGPGGQYVNKRMTAIRITHLPTKIVVSCQSERSQAQNRKKAMELLFSRLYQFLREKREQELDKIQGEKISASWGNQIRSYVLHPYKLVKDLRTGKETTKTGEVLDGELDEFIEAEIKTLKQK